jgi:hypothetical protein
LLTDGSYVDRERLSMMMLREFRCLAALAPAVLVITLTAAASSGSAVAAPKSAARVESAYGKLPLTFEENRGQTDRRVTFLSRTGGYTLFLTADEAVLRLPKAGAGRKAEGGRRNGNPAVLRMKVIGADRKARVAGVGAQETRVNYFLGNDPERWRAGVPTYSKVRY